MAADGSIVIETNIDDKKAQQELNRLNRKIQTLNDQLYVKQQQKIPLVEQAQKLGVELDAAKAKLDSMENSGKFFTSAHVDEQRAVVSSLQKEWDGVVVQIERMDRGIQETTTRLDLAKTQAGELYQNMAAQAQPPKPCRKPWTEPRREHSGSPSGFGKSSEARWFSP